MIDIKHSQEINWKNETYSHSSNDDSPSNEIQMNKSDNIEKEENHKRQQRRYR